MAAAEATFQGRTASAAAAAASAAAAAAADLSSNAATVTLACDFAVTRTCQSPDGTDSRILLAMSSNAL